MCNSSRSVCGTKPDRISYASDTTCIPQLDKLYFFNKISSNNWISIFLDSEFGGDPQPEAHNKSRSN